MYWLRLFGALAVLGALLAVAAVGCLQRPIVPQDPKTSNLYVAEIRQSAVTKIDLLFMIDNSISMADKQQILGEAVGGFMSRLVTPLCVDEKGVPTGVSSGQDGQCSKGSPEFTPIRDIHIGVVSSSLGAHGGEQCADGNETYNADDHGQLVPTVRQSAKYPVTTWSNSGFLVWDPDAADGHARHTPAGEANAKALTDNFKNMVLAVGQNGCGFEASLESWYRFLIEPDPYLGIPPGEPTWETRPQFVAPEQNPVLQQRKLFLRPDSLVAIVMLTDENDCSIVDYGYGFFVGQIKRHAASGESNFAMYRATSQCDDNPNDKCCTSCGATGKVDDCPSPADDPNCKDDPKTGNSWSPEKDTQNLRCYDQKRRFGMDLLYPVSRYVNGLYETTIVDAHGNSVKNPLYSGVPARDSSLVFIAGIVGVPWQDIAAKESWPDGAPLKYLKWEEMRDQGRWDWVLGDPGNGNTKPGEPLDKLMVETSKDRAQLYGPVPHPAIGNDGTLAPSSSTTRTNKINGHESNILHPSSGGIVREDDLQYACIFKLPNARPPCPDPNDPSCDCKSLDAAYNRPLCDDQIQTYAKAYPGLRQLRVLKEYGAKTLEHNAIVASICPKTLDDPNDPSYGYNPAVAAIVERLGEQLKGRCLPRRLTPDTEPNSPDLGKVPCVVVEAQPPTPGQACTCHGADKPGREDADDESKAAATEYLLKAKACGKDSQSKIACEDFCLCEIQQFQKEELRRCQSEAVPPSNLHGYCYIDPDNAPSTDVQAKQKEIVKDCPTTQRRMLRFTGENVPAKGATAIIECLGATIGK